MPYLRKLTLDSEISLSLAYGILLHMRKTTLYLRDQDWWELRRISYVTGLTQSDLIRRALRWLIARWGPDGESANQPLSTFQGEWLTRQEEKVVALTNARYADPAIARELGISLDTLGEVRHRLKEKIDRITARGREVRRRDALSLDHYA